MNKITTPLAPIPAGHYSQAITWQDLVFVSGQLPLDPVTGKVVSDNIEEQVRQVITNIQHILEASGSGLACVLKSNIFISDGKYWPEVNKIYAEIFETHKPARAIIPCGELHYGALIEMDVIATIRKA